MTNSQVNGTNLVVVDGSNIATEGRSIPSLAQLNEAVISLTQEFPDITVTVVVDATFGHRIAKSEVAEFDEAVAHNELVTPPAGAIGRGDAFVLSIANKVGARIFSNDSFQEFHGVYPWLFDEGRLIGGKPVPHVGWVFVNRVPVKGPLSRKARNAGRDGARDGARDGGASRRTASPLASLPMPVPTSPPPRGAKVSVAAAAEPADQTRSTRGRRRKAEAVPVEAVPATGRDSTPPATATAAPIGGPVNDLLPFLDFIQHNPVGSSVTGLVESYSSHGAYVAVGDLRGYVPLRLMGSPPPRSAREVMKSGERVTLVVASIAPARRSVDLAVPGVADVVAPEPPADAKPARARGAKKAAGPAAAQIAAAVEAAAAEAVAATVEPPRGRRKKAAAAPATATTPEPTTPQPGPAKKAATKRPAPTKRAAKAAAAEPIEPLRDVAPAKKSRAKKAAAAVAVPPVPDAAPANTRKAAAKKAAPTPTPSDPAETAETAAPTRRATPRRRAQRAN